MAPRPCTVTDCERVYYARGFCILHYIRWRRHGSTDKPKAHTPAKDAPANPWRGQQACPECGSSDWTLPFDSVDLPNIWNCCACGTTWTLPSLAQGSSTGLRGGSPSPPAPVDESCGSSVVTASSAPAHNGASPGHAAPTSEGVS